MARRILVVDDDHYLVEIYRRALLGEGYDVACAYDGKEGIELMKTIQQPDLIVLDLKMPKMTGDEFIKAIRRGNLYKKGTKVLVLSSVLYRYAPMPGLEDSAGLFGGHSYMNREGLTGIAKKAETGQPTEMMEKPEQLTGHGGFRDKLRAEDQAEYEKRVSEELLKKVKEMFGETYLPKQARQTGLMPHAPRSLIPARVIELTAECLKADKSKLSSATNFDKDLGICYVAQTKLRRRINKEFNVRIAFETHREIETIEDLIAAVEETKRFDAYERQKLNKESWEKDLKPMLVTILVAVSVIGFVFLIMGLLKSPGK